MYRDLAKDVDALVAKTRHYYGLNGLKEAQKLLTEAIIKAQGEEPLPSSELTSSPAREGASDPAAADDADDDDSSALSRVNAGFNWLPRGFNRLGRSYSDLTGSDGWLQSLPALDLSVPGRAPSSFEEEFDSEDSNSNSDGSSQFSIDDGERAYGALNFPFPRQEVSGKSTHLWLPEEGD